MATGFGNLSGNSQDLNIALPITLDTNKPFFIDLNVIYDDGTSGVHSIKSYVRPVTSNIDPFPLAFNVRRDFGCSTNFNDPCALGIIASIIFAIIVVFGIGKMIGVFTGAGSLVIAMVMLGIFTFVGWFYWPLYIFLVIGAFLAGSQLFLRSGN